MDVHDKSKQECKIAISLLRNFVNNHEFEHLEVIKVKISQWTGVEMFPTLLRPELENMEVTEIATLPRMAKYPFRKRNKQRKRKLEELNTDGALHLVCTISLSNHSDINDSPMEISDHDAILRRRPSNDLVLLSQGILHHLQKALVLETRFDDIIQQGFQVLAGLLNLCGFVDELQELVTSIITVISTFFQQSVVNELSTLPENAFWQAISIFTRCPSVANALLRVISIKMPEVMTELANERNCINEISFEYLDAFHYWLELLDACLETLCQSPVDKWQSTAEKIVTSLSTVSVTLPLNVAFTLLNLLEELSESLSLG